MTKEYILLPVHNRRQITRYFVECLCRQSFTNYHLILIDDGSTDGTSDMVLSQLPAATVLRGDGHLWWAGSLQMGLDWLKINCKDDTAIVLMINDDVTFEEQFLAAAVAELDGQKKVMLLAKNSCDQGRTIAETGVHANFAKLDFRIANPHEKINCMSTRGLFIRYEDIKLIGDFHPKVLPHYWSDYEYTMRGIRNGLSCITSQKVYLCADQQTTGHRQFEEMGRWEFFQKYFSKRSVLNPLYASIFLVLACPMQWIFQCLFRVWFNALKLCVKQLLKVGGNRGNDV